MAENKNRKKGPDSILNREQEELLDLYLQTLDRYHENLKASDAIQVEIETQHLKKILST